MSLLTDYIKVYDVDFPETFLEELLAQYQELFKPAHVIYQNQNILNSKYRSCEKISISTNIHNIPERRALDQIICREISRVLQLYHNTYPYMQCSQDSGYDLLKYMEGGFHEEHIDQHPQEPSRFISVLFVLNDDYEGGELAFFKKSYIPKVKKNQCIVFPSNFLFPHQVTPVTKGIRYSIITWLH